MPTHWIDFDSYTPGAGAPTGWSQTANNGTATWSVVAVGGGVGNVLQGSNSTSSPSTLTYDGANGDTGRGTCEVTAKLRMTTLGTAAGYNFGVVGRAQTGTNTGYEGFLRQQGASNIALRRGLSTLIASGTNAAVGTPVANTWYWCRIQCSGTAIRVRYWVDGSGEPGTWDVDTTDATYSDGPLGVLIHNNAGVYQFRYVGIGTNGDAAPITAPGGGALHGAASISSGVTTSTAVGRRGVKGAVAVSSGAALTSAARRGVKGLASISSSVAITSTANPGVIIPNPTPYSYFGTLTFGKTLLSLATSDPFEFLTSNPTSDREFVFRGYPKDSNGDVVNVDRSTSGYVSQPADLPYQQFMEGIRRPYNFTVSLPLPLLSGGTQLGIGDITQNNKDGSSDSAALLDWLGAQSDVYMGSHEPMPFSQFTNIFHGTAAGVVYDLDSVNILHRDLRFKIQRPLHRSRYKGTGSAIRGNGTTAYANATVNCPAGSMTFECSIRPLSIANASKYLINYQSGGAAGGRILRFDTGANNRLAWYVINDAGVLYVITADGLFPSTTQLKHIAAVLDVPNLRIRLYVDGEEAATPVVIAGTFNTILNNLTLLRRADTAVGYADVDIDNVIMWPVARTQVQIKANKDRELLGTEGMTSYWKVNEGSGVGPSANSVSGGVGLTLTNTTWVGSLEGDSSIAGNVKPTALGRRRQVKGKLVDSQRLVYQWHDGSMQGFLSLRDSGDPLTFGADLSDIYSATPSAGTYNTCKVMGLARLGSTPVGTITADIEGDNGGLIAYADKAATIHRKLMVDYGGLDNTSGVDDPAYNSLALLNTAVVGAYHDTAINVDAAGDLILQDINAWGGPKRTGIMTVGRIDDPVDSEPTIYWTEADLDQSLGNPFRSEPLGVRYKEIVIGYRPYHTTLSANEVAGVVGLSAREDFGQQYRYVSLPVPDASEDAATLTILTSMDSEADALAEINRLIPFRGRDLRVSTLSLKAGILSHFIGTRVSLHIQQTNPNGDVISRYDTAGGKKHVVISVAEDMGESGSPDRLQATIVG